MLSHWLGYVAGMLLLALLAYALLAYLVAPAVWRHYEHHPAMERAPKTTRSAAGIPADPLNVGLVGARAEVEAALLAAGWDAAAPITLRTSLGIAESVVLGRPDRTAPVSTLYLWGRGEDLAFEKIVGGSARQRHHVRLWCSEDLGTNGRPFWIGAATFDCGVGVGRRTGQLTHHIAPDVDAERDTLMTDLTKAAQVTQLYQVTGVGPTIQRRNGEGDRYYTDGELTVAVLPPGNTPRERPPERLPNPVSVTAKNCAWSWVRAVLHPKRDAP